MIKINTEKAKEIWKDKFRLARKPLLEKLDIEFMKAVEVSDTTLMNDITEKKQALRDITDIPLPDNINKLKSIWPDILI